MRKIILSLLLFNLNSFVQAGEWKWIDGWVYVNNTNNISANDSTAGGAIIQKKKENKNLNYSTIDGKRYVTTEEWKKIINYEEKEHTCLVIYGPHGWLYKGPEPSAGGLFQLGLVLCFFANRLILRRKV